MDLQTETFLETVYAPACIHQFLLSGKKRMALGADVNFEFLLRRACFKGLAADAAYDSLAVLGMDLILHDEITSSAHTMKGFKARIP